MVPGTRPQWRHHHRRMLLGLSRKAATDFSFFSLSHADWRAYSLYKERALLTAADIPMFSVGLVFSFISAWLCALASCAISAPTVLCHLPITASCLGWWCWFRHGLAWCSGRADNGAMTYLLRICRGLWGCTVLWGLGFGLPAMADEAPAAPKANESTKLNYVLGAIVSSGPDYAGGDGRSVHVPGVGARIWAVSPEYIARQHAHGARAGAARIGRHRCPG